MTINDIIDYVMHTPNNSNPAVLRGMLEGLEGDAPQPTPPEPEYITRVEEQEFTGEYNQSDNAYVATLISDGFEDDEIIVIYDDVEYTCEINSPQDTLYWYGGFTDYPFVIASEAGGTTFIYCQDGNKHTVEVKVEETSSNDFSIATVTLDGSALVNISGPFVNEFNHTTYSLAQVGGSEGSTALKVVLYKGQAIINSIDNSSVFSNMTADLTSFDNDRNLIVKGDGYATISSGGTK